MGVKTYSDINQSTKYTFHRKAGRSIIERRPVFSPDEESVLLIVENIVRVYNVRTGDCARILETERNVKELIGVQFPENENYNLYGCSSNGVVTTWTWENGAVLREAQLEIPDDSEVVTFNLLNDNDCFITAATPKSEFLHLGVYSVKNGQLLYNYKQMKIWYSDMLKVSVGVCNGDKYAAIINASKFLFVQNLDKPHLKTEIPSLNHFRILSVDAHSHESAIAITDTFGRVTVIRGDFFDDRSRLGKEILHWHHLPLFAVSFSVQGNYVYSGGMEKVLVKWTVGHLAMKNNEKSFIPRLPGMIRFVTASRSSVAITLTNNSVVIANALMRVQTTILECGGLSPVARAVGTSLVYHERLGGLLMGGRVGHLQLYSTASNKVLYNIDITGMNTLPSERRNLLPLETEVTCVAASANGNWLVTSEYRNDGVTYPEERLKFWHIQTNDSSPLKLNTCVNLSHGGCNVIALALNNKADFCVSAGTDQKFRIWKRDVNMVANQKTYSWSCLTACYYSSGIAQSLAHKVLNNYKNSEPYIPGGSKTRLKYMIETNDGDDIVKKIFNVHKQNMLLSEKAASYGVKDDDENDMGGIAISQDGSLIAAWFGCKLTLWDTHLCTLRTTLSYPALRPKGMHVAFGNNDAAHYLVCTTQNCVAVWSLLSLTVKWMVQISPTCLVADPLSNKMAVVTTNNDVFVFTPHSSTPILKRKQLVEPQSGVLKQCTFGAASGEDVRLYFMRNDSEIYCLEPESSSQERLEVISRRNLPTSNFSALLAEQQLSEVQAAAPGEIQTLDTDALGNSAIGQFLSAAPHMIPPVSLLCTSFLQHISGQEEQPEEPKQEQEEKMEVDLDTSDSEDEGPKLNGPFAPKTMELWAPDYANVKEKRLKKIQNEHLLDLHATASIFGL